jgi:hypothetical protein
MRIGVCDLRTQKNDPLSAPEKAAPGLPGRGGDAIECQRTKLDRCPKCRNSSAAITYRPTPCDAIEIVRRTSDIVCDVRSALMAPSSLELGF